MGSWDLEGKLVSSIDRQVLLNYILSILPMFMFYILKSQEGTKEIYIVL